MKKHLKRKTICDPTKEDISLDSFKDQYFKLKTILYTCEKCNKGFTSNYGHSLHISKCKIIKSIEDIDNIETTQFNELKENINELKIKFEKLEDKIDIIIKLLKSI